MISDFCSNHFKISVRYLSKWKFTCPPVFLLPKSAKMCTIFANSIEKLGRFWCSVLLGPPLILHKVVSIIQQLFLNCISYGIYFKKALNLDFIKMSRNKALSFSVCIYHCQKMQLLCLSFHGVYFIASRYCYESILIIFDCHNQSKDLYMLIVVLDKYARLIKVWNIK